MEDKEIYIEKILSKIENSTILLLKEENLFRPFVKRTIINKLIKDIHLSDIDTNKEIKYFYTQKNILDEHKLKDYLNYHGLTKKDLHQQILLPLKIFMFSQKKFKNILDSHFLKRKGSLDKYTYNVLRVDDSNLAYELYFQLEAGESNFQQLSLTYSLDFNIFPKGIAGPTSLEGTHPIIVKALKEANPDFLIKPFKVEKWWMIIKLIQRDQASLDFETAKSLLQELFEVYIEKKVNQAIADHTSKTIHI